MSWLDALWAERSPLGTGCGHCCFPVDRTVCGARRKEKERYLCLVFSFPINFGVFVDFFPLPLPPPLHHHGLLNSRIHSLCLDLSYCPSVCDEGPSDPG